MGVKRWFKGAVLSAAMLMFALAASVAAQGARPVCGAADAFYATLAEQYGEARAFVGLHPSGAVLELWLNPQSGSWTVLVTQPDSQACVALAGQAGEMPRIATGERL